MSNCTCEDCTARRASAVQQPADEDRADAERYRWMRENAYRITYWRDTNELETCTRLELDATIDAIRSPGRTLLVALGLVPKRAV